MADTTSVDTIREFPRRQARTMRFSYGAPRSAKAVGDGSRALFLRSAGPEDSVTSLWMSVIDADGTHRETLLADPRELLPDADGEHVPDKERERRERARERGRGIVSYSVDAAGCRVAFTINAQLFLTQIDADGQGGRTRQLAPETLNFEDIYGPVLNPRISPDGRRVLYSTGKRLMLVDIAAWDAQRDNARWRAVDGDPDPFNDQSVEAIADLVHVIYAAPDANDGGAWTAGLAEFVAGEEMDRYDGFWWSPDSRRLLFECFDSSPEPLWYISDPANPQFPALPRRYPRALTRNADVHLYLAELDCNDAGRLGETKVREVTWDRESYEYLAAVSWTAGHDPIMLVQNRRQTRDQVLEIQTGARASADSADSTTADRPAPIAESAVGAEPRAVCRTRTLEEHTNDQWLDLIQGTPSMTPDGRLICAFNDMDTDTNRLTVDGKPFTPAGWQVREVLDVTDADVLAVVQRTPALAASVPAAWRDEAGRHDARAYDVASIDYGGNVSPVSRTPGVWTATRRGGGTVLSGRDMDGPLAHMTHSCRSETSANMGATGAIGADQLHVHNVVDATVATYAAEPGFTPNTTFTELGEHRLKTAITRPGPGSAHAGDGRLPVLLKPYGGPGFQQVMLSQSYYWDSQWWADQGFLVVTADGRGTTGRGPRWDRAIFERMKEVTLADQIEAVRALPEVAPEADLDKVAIIGWSYGGFLSALAVLDAPDVVHAACAGAPPTDWTLYDTHYTERYLGLDPAVYRANGIVGDAPKLRRPLMLIHGFADDNVSIANSLRLSQALIAAGRPHTFLPLTGITHMANEETVAENLLLLQRDFLFDALGLPDPAR